MKKILLFLACGMLPIMGFGAFQYEIVKSSPGGGFLSTGIWGSVYTVKVTEGAGQFYITDKITSISNANLNTAFSSVATAYGTVDLATNTMHNASGETVTVFKNDSVTQTGYAIGSYKAGDEFAIWLANNNNVNGASAGSLAEEYNDWGVLSRGESSETDALGNRIFFVDYVGSSKVEFGVQAVGQPLPGVLLALGCMGGVGGLVQRLRRRK